MDKKAATIIATGLVLCGLLIGAGIAVGPMLKPKPADNWGFVPRYKDMTPQQREAWKKASEDLARSY